MEPPPAASFRLFGFRTTWWRSKWRSSRLSVSRVGIGLKAGWALWAFALLILEPGLVSAAEPSFIEVAADVGRHAANNLSPLQLGGLIVLGFVPATFMIGRARRHARHSRN